MMTMTIYVIWCGRYICVCYRNEFVIIILYRKNLITINFYHIQVGKPHETQKFTWLSSWFVSANQWQVLGLFTVSLCCWLLSVPHPSPIDLMHHNQILLPLTSVTIYICKVSWLYLCCYFVWLCSYCCNDLLLGAKLHKVRLKCIIKTSSVSGTAWITHDISCI